MVFNDDPYLAIGPYSTICESSFWSESQGDSVFMLFATTYLSLFDLFFSRVNVWFPFLERTQWINEHINVFDPPTLAATRDNCLALLVASLGSLAENQSIGFPQSAESQTCMLAAQVMLPAVDLGNDLVAVQCLILFWYFKNVDNVDIVFIIFGSSIPHKLSILSAWHR